MQHLAIHIRQPEIAAEVAGGQLQVIEAEQAQQRGMEVVDMDFAGHGAATKVRVMCWVLNGSGNGRGAGVTGNCGWACQ